MYYNSTTQIFLNGDFINAQQATTNLYSQTLHYGSGVFEGIRAYNTPTGTHIFKATEHFQRLLNSAKAMHIQIPEEYTTDFFEKICYKLLKINNFTDAYIRPLVYLGENMSLTPTPTVNIAIMCWEWGRYLGDKMLNVGLSSYQRPNPKSVHIQAKIVGHYTNSILATTEAKANGYDEALLTDHNGYIAEGSGANFFYEKNNQLYTPPLGSILAGITRQTVFEIAQKLNITITETHTTPEQLIAQAQSCFFCGTAAEIIGIQKLNNYIFPLAWENSIGFKIQNAYKKIVLQQPII